MSYISSKLTHMGSVLASNVESRYRCVRCWPQLLSVKTGMLGIKDTSRRVDYISDEKEKRLFYVHLFASAGLERARLPLPPPSLFHSFVCCKARALAPFSPSHSYFFQQGSHDIQQQQSIKVCLLVVCPPTYSKT